MISLNKRLIVLVTLLAFAFSATGCGYILYPARRTEPRSDVVDAKTVVFDCLWLIAGVVPGVVALLVDGLAGTWYYTEAEAAEIDEDDVIVSMNLEPGTNFQMNFRNPAPQDAKLRLTLRDAGGRTFAAGEEVSVSSGDLVDNLAIRIPENAASGRLEMNVNGQIRWAANVNITEK